MTEHLAQAQDTRLRSNRGDCAGRHTPVSRSWRFRTAHIPPGEASHAPPDPSRLEVLRREPGIRAAQCYARAWYRLQRSRHSTIDETAGVQDSARLSRTSFAGIDRAIRT